MRCAICFAQDPAWEDLFGNRLCAACGVAVGFSMGHGDPRFVRRRQRLGIIRQYPLCWWGWILQRLDRAEVLR